MAWSAPLALNPLVRWAHLNIMHFNPVKCKVTHLGAKTVGYTDRKRDCIPKAVTLKRVVMGDNQLNMSSQRVTETVMLM